MKLENTGRKLALVIAFTVLSLAIFVYLVGQAGVQAPWSRPYEANVILPDAYRLVPEADVREAGVKVGKISDVEYRVTPKAINSRVTLQMDPGHELHRDARVLLRFKTVANENYLDLSSGTSRAGRLPSGSMLPTSNTRESVQLDQILGTFDVRTRERVKQNLDALGGGVDGDDLSRVLGRARPVGEEGRQVLGVLEGQRRQVASVIANTSTLLQAFANRTESVRTLARQARVSAEAASSRDRQIASAIQELPGTLRQVRSTVARLGSFSGRTAPVVADLTDVTRQATPLLRDLGPAAASARPLVRELPTAVRQARPLLAQLTPFANRLRPAVTSLDAVLRQANPLLGYLGPYSREVGSFFANNGSALGAVDASGHIGRVFGILSPSSYTGLSESSKQAINTLVEPGTVGEAGPEEVNPFPKPGTVGAPQRFDGRYPRLNPRPSYLEDSEAKRAGRR